MTIGDVKISYVQVPFDNRYYKVSYSKYHNDKALMIPCGCEFLVDALVEGLISKMTGGETYETEYYLTQYNKFQERVLAKDEFLDRD